MVLLSLFGTAAHAYDFEVTARTEGYGYQLRRYDRQGISFVNRRRITQYLGLRIFNLLDPGQHAFGPDGKKRPPRLLTVHALMRFDTDFGGYVRPLYETPEIENNQLDLMLGALEGRNLWGWLDFTLGRQFDAELMDFFAYDGLRVRINSPWHLYAQTHFGVQTARERPFTATVFETDGTSADTSMEAWSPTFGVALGIDGLRGIHLRTAYRGTASRAPRAPDEEGEASESLWGIDQELLFFSASYQIPVLGTRPLFGLRYNFLGGQIDDLQAAILQQLGRRHRIHLEFLRSRPHFDGDSIFNIFTTEPFDELGGRYSWQLIEQLELNLRLGYRRFWSAPEEGSNRADAYSCGLGGLWRSRRLQAALDLYYLGGLGDGTVGGDLEGIWGVLSWLKAEGRLSLVRFQSDRRGTDDVLNFGFQVGVRVQLFTGVLVHLMVEDNISRLNDSALRLLGVLDLEFAK